MEKSIALTEELVCYLQRLEYEIAGRRIVVERLLSAGQSGPVFDRYHRKYLDTIAEKELALEEIRKEYAPDTPSRCAITVDFTSRIMHIQQSGRGCWHGNAAEAIPG